MKNTTYMILQKKKGSHYLFGSPGPNLIHSLPNLSKSGVSEAIGVGILDAFAVQQIVQSTMASTRDKI